MNNFACNLFYSYILDLSFINFSEQLLKVKLILSLYKLKLIT